MGLLDLYRVFGWGLFKEVPGTLHVTASVDNPGPVFLILTNHFPSQSVCLSSKQGYDGTFSSITVLGLGWYIDKTVVLCSYPWKLCWVGVPNLSAQVSPIGHVSGFPWSCPGALNPWQWLGICNRYFIEGNIPKHGLLGVLEDWSWNPLRLN